MNCGPVAKIRPSAAGTSVSETAWALRRKASVTGRSSQTATATASSHHGTCGCTTDPASSTVEETNSAATSSAALNHQIGWTRARTPCGFS